MQIQRWDLACSVAWGIEKQTDDQYLVIRPIAVKCIGAQSRGKWPPSDMEVFEEQGLLNTANRLHLVSAQ